MRSLQPRSVETPGRRLTWAATLLLALALGCASPGPPHAPSLNLPKPPNDLTALRSGNHVELHFTAPLRSTDNLPLSALLRVNLCRQLPRQACVPVLSAARDIAPSKPGAPNRVTLSDDLPDALTQGPAQLLAYHVQLLNPAGQSAGASEPAITVAGVAPPTVDDLHAEGSRLGVLLQWTPAPAAAGEVILNREDLSAAATTTSNKRNGPANLTRLAANSSARTLDTTAKPGVPYRYTALRQRTVQLGGRTIELRSAPSTTVPFTLQLVYSPVAPSALTAAGYLTAATSTAPSTFAVDLIWQPVDETGLLAGLTGYNIYRETLDPAGKPTTPRQRLNPTPVQVPSFRDETALPTARYRYSVTAIDTQRNESPAATTTLEPDAHP